MAFFIYFEAYKQTTVTAGHLGLGGGGGKMAGFGGMCDNVDLVLLGLLLSSISVYFGCSCCAGL